MHIQQKRSGFTLIELLTVIAIIGILASILIPVVGSVRDAAKAAACTSNLRQIGMAFQLYAQENGGQFPNKRVPTIQIHLIEDLEPYTERGSEREVHESGDHEYVKGVWRCDSAPGYWRTTYLTNHTIWNWESGNVPGININQIKDPTRFPLQFDRGGGERGPTGEEPSNFGHRWHSAGINTAFGDGSVRPVEEDELRALIKPLESPVNPL